MDRNSCCLASGLLAFVFCFSCAGLGWALSLAAAPTTTIAMWLAWRAYETMGRDNESDLSNHSGPTPLTTHETTARRAASLDSCEGQIALSVLPRPRPFKALGVQVHDKRDLKIEEIGACHVS
jgi:hypothetical protein